MKKRDLLVRREKVPGKGTPLFYRDPSTIIPVARVRLFDDIGKQSIDE